MDLKTKETYSEVYSVLNMLGDSYKNKLPNSLLDMIKEEKLDSYNPEYNSNIKLDKQNVKRETIAMIALFHLNYWCDNDEEKNKLRVLLKNNEEQYQSELREKYNPDDIFKKKQEDTKNKKDMQELNNNLPIEVKKEKFYEKIVKFFKRIFHL